MKSSQVVPLKFNIEEVGKHVKSSKKRYTWEVSLTGKHHRIVLDFSLISGKAKVAIDYKIVLQNQLPPSTSFQYPFTLDGNSLNIIQQGDSFELRINNKAFSHLYNQAKTNKEFKKYEDQVKDFKVQQNQFQAKKLILNIGGVCGVKKKPLESNVSSHNWNAFGEEQTSGFPNYFEQSPDIISQNFSKVSKQANQSLKKSESLLEDFSNSKVTKKLEGSQNILDFESQLQKAPIHPRKADKSQQQMFKMQLMFSELNLASEQQKPSSIIDNEIDFFCDTNSKNFIPNQQPPQIDFFAEIPDKVNPQQKQAPLYLNNLQFAQRMASKEQILGQQSAINNNLNRQYSLPQVAPNEGFAPSFISNTQQFGGFLGQASKSPRSLRQQQKNEMLTPQFSAVQSQPFTFSAVTKKNSEINPLDFGSVQFLIQANSTQGLSSIHQPINLNQSNTKSPKNAQKPLDFFDQQIAKGTGPTQSPNNIFLNSYGSQNKNMPLQVGLGGFQQFSMPIENSLMKKPSVTSSNAIDLL